MGPTSNRTQAPVPEPPTTAPTQAPMENAHTPAPAAAVLASSLGSMNSAALAAAGSSSVRRRVRFYRDLASYLAFYSFSLAFFCLFVAYFARGAPIPPPPVNKSLLDAPRPRCEPDDRPDI
ncbi:hypothetical protein DIPPA_16266 [Diplonema papillatum]|nr:hypothetical protein DIPPA_16266 [Diplonema papillatum]